MAFIPGNVWFLEVPVLLSGFVGMKFLVAVCILAGLSWLIASSLIGPEFVELDYQDRAARDYIKRALPKIVDKWDFKALEARTTGEQHVSENWKLMPGKFKAYRESLGPSEYFDTLDGAVEIDKITDTVQGTYTQRVKFKFAMADIAVAVVKRNGAWKISRFSVRSAALPAALDDDHV